MLGKHGIQAFKVVVLHVLLLFDVFVHTSAHPFFGGGGQVVFPNILKCQIISNK